MKKGLLVLLAISCMALTPLVSQQVKASEDIAVGQATTLEEKVLVAKNNLSLNIDLDNVVTSIVLPKTGLYKSVITWSSSNEAVATIDEANGRAVIVRPAVGQDSVKVTLTANVSITEKGVKEELNKEFVLTILPLQNETEIVEAPFSEDFNSYATGEEISEYLNWNLKSGDGVTEIVDSVPNNNVVNNNKVLKINSTKTASNINYVTSLYATGNIVFEGYVMYYGEINGVYFDLGANNAFGPSFGLTHEYFYYAQNGDRALDSSVAAPKEGVWTKFRIEVNNAVRTYSLSLYSFDGQGGLISVGRNIAYASSNRFTNQLRIRLKGGDKLGAVYFSSAVVDQTSNVPVNDSYNPNRTHGIGKIDGFQESVLYINGEEVTYDRGFEVYNRFDPSMKYTQGTDYTISSKELVLSDSVVENTYTITLLETGEVKELKQVVYKEDATSLPYIENFKGSHLAVTVDPITNIISTTGTITISGQVRRDDGKIYYALLNSSETIPTKEQIKTGDSSYVKYGSVEQTTRDISIELANLTLKQEYNLFVFVENANGSSEIYSKKNITEVINITTCEEFYDMTVNVNTYKNEFKLMNDLDFADYNWISDVSNSLKFEGTLDGQGHTISNLNITSPYRKAAIFFEITNATVKNLVFTDCSVSGLQDTALIAGFSNGGTIENIAISNTKITYNQNEGSEGYFAMIVGRLQKETTNMKNISIVNSSIDCNKYSGALTGNVNKGTNCILNVSNIYCDIKITCEGAAVGLIGRNRGTTNIDNAIVYLDVPFVKKEVAVVAGHNKEGGKLNVSNLIGKLTISEITQPTYFNNFIGSHDANTSSYTFSNVYFFKVDYSHISEDIIANNYSRTAGTVLTENSNMTQQWWEQNTFITSFETNSIWNYDAVTQRPVFAFGKVISVTADQVNALINNIKDDYSADDHYYISKALKLYASCSETEKAKVNTAKLNASKEKYDAYIQSIKNVVDSLGGN